MFHSYEYSHFTVLDRTSEIDDSFHEEDLIRSYEILLTNNTQKLLTSLKLLKTFQKQEKTIESFQKWLCSENKMKSHFDSRPLKWFLYLQGICFKTSSGFLNFPYVIYMLCNIIICLICHFRLYMWSLYCNIPFVGHC